jgi:branched-chain amino acid transport system ATP-binding protein
MPEPLLHVGGIDAYYGDFQALFGVSLKVEPGQVVAVIGANGAGKSTLLRCISGLMHPRQGGIAFAGESIGSKPAYAVLKRGIAMVPEGRRLFPSLSVEENLLIGGTSAASTSCSPYWPNGAISWRRRSPAASSRWRRSRAR